MRVLHVTITDGADGAGIAALRLHKCLRESGVESDMLVKFKRSDDEHVHEINKFPLLDYICNAFTYWVSFRHWFTINAIFIRRHRLFRAADIIHVHNIQYESFFSPFFFPRDKKIAWTFHDMWAITGHCNYTFGLCEKYVSGCGGCPLNKSGPVTAFEYLKRLIPWKKGSARPEVSRPRYVPTHLFLDNTKWVWRFKQRLYRGCDLSVVTPSIWLHDEAKRSPILNGAEVRRIPNPVDIDRFQPVKGGRPEGVIRLLYVGQARRGNVRKGFGFLIDALQYLNPQEYRLMLVGQLGNDERAEISQVGFEFDEYGIQSGDERMSRIYQRADILIVPSLHDNLPNTIVESMACGTPVVAFDTGGICDLVNRQTGYLANLYDSKDLATGIEEVRADRHARSTAARNHIVSLCANEVVGRQMSAYYDDIVASA